MVTGLKSLNKAIYGHIINYSKSGKRGVL